ncbi:iron uptake transporter deferrochelatase/peroxidase subunit [Arthrobacter sp. Marseille-P9274]|uniref:iron uptake transporter deferrochelatase/peroxidase subunit n=1 Tax=Arthrobacter sp. Marseille-P9274 TaxID=2866572 RepID=UPI0021C79B2D|nr:iron uptake transporter deferrochelatase/peroxidase subunit [Arthrobacter sp. Marseille-P9274]
MENPEAPGARSPVTRRRLLSMAGAAAAGAGIGIAADRAIAGTGRQPAAVQQPGVHPFYGEHQAGITTPAQDRLHFAAFDVADISRPELVSLLQDWTTAAAQMSQGRSAGDYPPDGGPYEAPPEDTGEAMDLPAASLTITFGFGATLFKKDGTDRFGLASRRPRALEELPSFPGDMLDPSLCGGDLCIQACADDPQVAVHAVRNLSRIAFGRAVLRWSQLGFGRTSSTSTAQATPRNLLGFKDGTANIKAEDDAAVREHVWVPPGSDQEWMTGGTYLVTRKIRMTIETWDRTRLSEQERVIGRTKGTGSPLSGGTEFSTPDFRVEGHPNEPLIPANAHIRLAHPSHNSGSKMLRRGYNFVDGNDTLGRLNAGLFFICCQQHPDTFTSVQSSLAKSDLLNEYIRHVGSALFAIPPGTLQGQHIGEPLFT